MPQVRVEPPFQINLCDLYLNSINSNIKENIQNMDLLLYFGKQVFSCGSSVKLNCCRLLCKIENISRVLEFVATPYVLRHYKNRFPYCTIFQHLFAILTARWNNPYNIIYDVAII